MKHLTKFKFLEDYVEEVLDNGTSVLPNVSYVEDETNGNKVKFYVKPYRTAKFIPSDTQPYVLLFKDWRNLGNVWVDGVKLDELKEYKFTVTKDDVTYTEDGWYELNSQKTQNLPHVRSYEILLENEQIKDDDELFLLINAAYGSAMLEHIGTINDCIMHGVVSYGAKKQSLFVNAAIFEYGFFGGVGGFILRNGEIVNTVNKLIHGTSDELNGIRITNDNWMNIQIPNISAVDTIRLVVDNIDDINDKTYVIGINSGQYFILTPLTNVGSYYNNGQLTLPLAGGSLDGLLAFAELDENENVVKVLDSTVYLSIGYQDDVPYDSVTVAYSGQSEVNVTFETLNRFVTPTFEFSHLSELGKDALKYVTSISYDAFYYCSDLTSIEIPSSVTSIGGSAFYNCYFERDKFINNSSLTDSNNWGAIFYDVIQDDGLCISGTTAVKCRPNATNVIIPSNVTNIGGNAFSGHTNLTSVTILDGVTSIGYSAFNNCYKLTSVTIPDSVTSIGSNVFFNTPFDKNLPNGDVYLGSCYYKYKGTMPINTSITIKDGTKSICGYAFDGCTSLSSIDIPDSVTSIGNSAFNNCYNLTSVTIPDSVTSIDDSAFRNCSSLSSIIIPDSVTSIDDSAFYGCTSLSSIDIPDSVTSIGNYAFSGCTSLTSVAIGSGVTSIGQYAFYNCSGLTSIVIPDSVTSIGNNVFRQCSGLTSVTIGSGVTSISNSAFYGCTRLRSVAIPDSITSIGNGAFRGCSGLTSVTIPSNVTEIESNAFRGSKLWSITCLATTAPILGSDVFAYLLTSGILYVPSGSDYSSWLSELGGDWSIEYI